MKVRSRQRLRSLGLVVGMAATLIGFSSTSAYAQNHPAPAPVRHVQPTIVSGTLTASFTASASGARAAGVRPSDVENPPTITCWISTTVPTADTAQNVHVYAWGDTHCGANVAEISVDHTLSARGTQLADASPIIFDYNDLPTQPTAFCAGGTWTTYVQAFIIFPTGYYPSSGIIHASASSEIAAAACNPPPPPPPPGGGGGGGGGCGAVLPMAIAPDFISCS